VPDGVRNDRGQHNPEDSMTRTLRYALITASALSVVTIARSQSLPQGPGQDLVKTACSNCHELGRVTNTGHTPQDWKTIVAMMINVGARLDRNQIDTITAYLSQNFPEKPKPAAVVIPGNADVSFTEWEVPTPGSRPHDPLAYADGSIWYTGHMANVLGRLDPKTGDIREFHPEVPMSGPHGLTADSEGNIWFTANFAGYIGKLNPKTGAFTEYPLPDQNAHDPHTPLFDWHGVLWFTVQSANMVGRLDPRSGAVKLVTVPTPRANPYGLVINSQGIPFFDEFGTNKLGSIDPETMAIREYVLPHPDTRPRRIAISADDRLWYTDYSRGYLGRFDPKTGQTDEWPSPGGPKSQPYAISEIHGAIWYVETATKPNALVRFDEASHAFQTWPIPGGGGVVRNMMPTPDGDLVMAESGVNRVALVHIR
jgi:virginiamycin B lyase